MQPNKVTIRLRTAGTALGLLLINAVAWAQQTGDGGTGRGRLGLVDSVVSTLLFGLVGIFLAILGFKLFDLVVRHNMEHEILENKNMAAALLAGAVILGISLIVAATILS